MGLTVEDAALLSRHLASTRSFSKAFDCYLSYILRVRDESAVALRTRAIKCLAEVVAVDPSIMERVCFCVLRDYCFLCNLVLLLYPPCFTGYQNSEAVYPACRKRRLLGTYQLQSDC